MPKEMTEERLQWFKTLVAVHEPELGELFREIDRLRSALTQPPRQSIASDEIPYRGPFVFSAFGSGVAPARPELNNPHVDPGYPNLVLGVANNGQAPAQPAQDDCAKCGCMKVNHIPSGHTEMKQKCSSCNACDGYVVLQGDVEAARADVGNMEEADVERARTWFLKMYCHANEAFYKP
jgi:hypothetical protein